MKINLTRPLLLAGILLSCLVQAQEGIYVQKGAGIVIQDKALLAVQGSIRLEHGSVLQNNGVVAVGHQQPATAADWIDQTTVPYHYGTGLVSFSGTGNQTVASINTFGSLEVNNTDLNLASTVSARRWILTNGKVNTHSNTAIALDAASDAVTSSATNTGYKKSWFNGTLRRFVLPATVDQYTFPVGNQHSAYLAILDNLTANPMNIQYLDLSFEPKPGTDMGLSCKEDNKPYTAIRNEGIWKLRANKEQVAGAYNVRLAEVGFSSAASGSLGIVVRELASAQAADWTVPAQVSNSTSSVLNGQRFIQRQNLSVLGQLGLGVKPETANTMVGTGLSTDNSHAVTTVVAGPNPAVNQLRIRTDKVVPLLKGFISTTNGIVVKSFAVQNNGIIYLTDLKPGTYLVTLPDLDGSGKSWQQKFLLIK